MTSRKLQFGYYFAMLHRMVIARCKQDIMDLGIQVSQIPFIAELIQCDQPVTQDDLSQSLAIDKSATARALDQLEKNGFVTRIVNPENRRQKLVGVTEKTKAIQDRFLGILQSTSNVFVQNFSPEEKKQLIDLMNRMLNNASTITS